VVRLDVDKRHVIVGPKDLLATRMVPLREINWLGDDGFLAGGERQIAVKVRSTKPPIDAVLRPVSDTQAEVELLVAEGRQIDICCLSPLDHWNVGHYPWAMIYKSASEWRSAPHKHVLLFAMSGLGKTYLSSMLCLTVFILRPMCIPLI